MVPIPKQRYVNIYGTDITKRKEMEKQITKSNQELEVLAFI